MHTRITRLVALGAGVIVALAMLPVAPAVAGTAWGCHYEDNNPAPVCDYPPKPACQQIGTIPPTFTPSTEGCKWVQRNGGVSVTWGMPIPYDHCTRGPDGFSITNLPCFDWGLGAGVGQLTSGVYSVEPTDKPYIGSPNGSCFLTSKDASPGYYAAECDFGLLHPETPIDITVELDVNLFGVPGKTLYTGWYLIQTYKPSKPVAVINYSQNKNAFHFDGGGSAATSPFAEVNGWSWTIDGVNAGSTKQIDKTFATPGKHKVELVVIDSKGVSSDVTTIFVDPSTAPGIKVNSTGDAPAQKPSDGCYTGATISGGDPECTLRAAIQALNAGFADTITFDIPSSNATITPASTLPNITKANATIDGTTQKNGRVAIDKEGLIVDHVAGVTVKGLNFTSSSSYGLSLIDALNTKITGNKFGIAPDGSAKPGSGSLVLAGSTGTVVGGTGADANVITGTKTALLIAASQTHDANNMTITNNFIGVDETGKPIGNGSFGILALAAGSQVAKKLTVSGNTVAGFTSNIVVAGDGMESASITGNLVGVDPGATKTIGSPVHNIRADAVPKLSITNNTVSGAVFDILDAGSLQLTLEVHDDNSFNVTLNTPLSSAFTGPKVGTANNVSGNHVGLIGVNAAARDGIRMWEAADGDTVTDNVVAGHLENEIRINASKNHKVTGNVAGIGAATGSLKAANGIALDTTDTSTVSGNIVGNVSTAYSLKVATKTTFTGNTAGLDTDGVTKAAVNNGVVLDSSSRGSQIGPQNTLANATATGLVINAADTTVTGNRIGLPTIGAGSAGNQTGIRIDTGLENVVIGGSSGDKNVIANNETGIVTNGKDVKITFNTFGLAGTDAQGNGTAIDVFAGSASIANNTIANSTTNGVRVRGGTATIRTNSIYATGTTNGIGGAPNAPALEGAARIIHGTSVRTWLVIKNLPTSSAGTIEVFGNASCSDPEGKTPLFTKSNAGVEATRVISIIGRPTLHGITVTYTDGDGKTSVFSNCVEPLTMPDTDGDGIPDIVEDAAPTPTGAAPNNASFVTDNDQWITIISPDGTKLTDVAPIDDPNPSGHAGKSFPFGFVDFKATGFKSGEIAKIAFAVSGGTRIESWYKYGPKTRDAGSTFWGFGYDKKSKTGAQVSTVDLPGFGLSTVVTLNIADGGRGDEDFLANGTVVDPGALTTTADVPVENTGSETPTGGPSTGTSGSGTSAGTSGTLPFTGSSSSLAWIAFWTLLAGGFVLTATRKLTNPERRFPTHRRA